MNAMQARIVPVADDRVRKGDPSQQERTKTASPEGPKDEKNPYVDAMKEASACFLQNFNSDDTIIAESWKSNTSTSVDSDCTTHEELTATGDEVSSCVDTEDDDDDDLRTVELEELLEEALAKTVTSECQTIILPSKLIVPYPGEECSSKRRPAPWDSSSSESTSSSCTPNTPRSTGKTDYQDRVNNFTSLASPDNSREKNPSRKESMDFHPSVPRRRSSNDHVNDSSHPKRGHFLGFVKASDDAKNSLELLRDTVDAYICRVTDLESFLISQLPENIISKLSKSEWNQVCTAIAQFPTVMENCETAEKQDNAETDNDSSVGNCASVVSELTGFTSFIGFFNKEDKDEKGTDESFLPKLPLSREQQPAEPRRLWHDTTRGSAAAPQIPSRTNSEPISPIIMLRTYPSTSSSPRDIVSLSRRSVSFDSVEVRLYEQVLDLNPSTTSGPSVGIGWNYTTFPPQKVLDVELSKDQNGRRPLSQIVIPRIVREEILKDCGYTPKQIAKAVRMNLKARNQRKQTIHNYKIDQIVEKSSCQVRRLFRPSRWEI